MSDEIRDITTVTFSGQRLPKGFEEAIRLKFCTIEQGSAAVPIKRVVTYDPSLLFPKRDRADEIDEAAQLIDETIAAVSEDGAIPERMPKSVLPLLAGLGESLREGEAIKTQASRSSKAAEFTRETRTRVERLLDAVYEDAVDLVGEVRAADVDQHRLKSGSAFRAISPRISTAISTAARAKINEADLRGCRLLDCAPQSARRPSRESHRSLTRARSSADRHKRNGADRGSQFR